MAFGRKKREEATTSLFFATDIHGSERCFRKFLNAAKFYGVDHLVLGGDITGKTLVPIERTPRGWSASVLGIEHVDMTEADRGEVERRIRDMGRYPVVGERDELAALSEETHMEEVFCAAVVDSMRRWVELAEERLAGTGIRCFVAPGNDDYWEIDDALRGSEVVEFVEGRRVRLDDDHEMITTGYSNRTPWDSPRELDEADLRALIDRMFAEVEDPAGLVCVFHPPPEGTELDQAPAIDEEFRVQIENGETRMIHVGSTAVRDFILERRPLLGLHGHVHDSRAAQQVGRTLCLNPGSQYSEGVLMGAIVRLSANGISSNQFVVG
jgi:Icc-related predicted phosphoesterase